MSETCGGCVYDGRPLDGVELRLAQSENGARRIEIRGPMLMSGYRMRADLDQELLVDGWLRTNDAGEWDGDRLVVTGRLDDVIITGGENVVAGHIAGLVVMHPHVRDAVVVGVPDDEWGQRVVAVVVAEDDAVPSTAELRDWVKERATSAGAPRQVVVIDALPLLPSGKPDLQAVRELVSGGQAAPTRSESSQSAEPPSVT
jgi:O-succinylbenzoic acid--CoA ligase